MNARYKFAAAAVMAVSLSIAVSEPAAAHVDVSISVGVPGLVVGGPAFVGDYDFNRPCGWYHHWSIPAPERCYHDFWSFYGPNVYIVDGFVFRDHQDFERWRDRDDWEHWRVHEFHRADWHDNGLHRGWHKHHHDEDVDDDDHGDDRHNDHGHHHD